MPRRDGIQQIRSRPLINNVDKDIRAGYDVISEVVALPLPSCAIKSNKTMRLDLNMVPATDYLLGSYDTT